MEGFVLKKVYHMSMVSWSEYQLKYTPMESLHFSSSWKRFFYLRQVTRS